MNFFSLISDIADDVPDIQRAIPVVMAVFADVRAGHMPTVTPQEIMLVEKLVTDVKKLLGDMKT